jgi:hypothetical protein
MCDRLCRGAAPRRQAEYFEFGHDALQRQAHVIANSNAMRRFDALRIEMDLTAIDGSGGETSRLEESGMPQPFVQAMIVTLLCCCHGVGF